MFKFLAVCTLAICGTTAFAAQDVAGAVAGTIKTIDRTGKVVVVKTMDGTEHTFHYAGDLAVYTGDEVKTVGDDTFHGATKGSKVAVHYTVVEGRETAHEIDKLSEGGLKVIKGTLTHVDRTARRVSVATAAGTEETLELSARATDDAATAVGKGTEKATKVSIFYTEDAGKKTAHFIEKS